MIIDSHAHYSHQRYDIEIPYLYLNNDKYEISRSDRDELLERMLKSGIVGFVEPSIDFEMIESQLAFVEKYKDHMWATIGVHPTRCNRTQWKNRKKLAAYAQNESVIGIGETGLDYHYPRRKQRRHLQKKWFIYQLKLAHILNSPLVLHIRMAHKDAIKILRKYRKIIKGGVVHCFTGDYETAKEYTSLGLKIGIGGKLLGENMESDMLCEAISRLELNDLLIETDSPFVLPNVVDLTCSSNTRKKLCNSSFILPQVIKKISECKKESIETVERAVYQNTVKLFNLKI